jgi:hypothetical protein
MIGSSTRLHYLEIATIVIAFWVDDHQGNGPPEDALLF